MRKLFIRLLFKMLTGALIGFCCWLLLYSVGNAEDFQETEREHRNRDAVRAVSHYERDRKSVV